MRSPAFPRADDLAALVRLTAGRCPPGRIVLDGSRPAYLVGCGCADLFAVPRHVGPETSGHGRFVGTVGVGCVVPSSTVLAAWQLVLVPRADAVVQQLPAAKLHAIGYGTVAGPASRPVIPAPRVTSAAVAVLARGVDATLRELADVLRTARPPVHAVPIRPGQLLSLEAGAAVRGGADVSWLRVAGGHARRNGELGAVFGGGEPALLAAGDWIVVDTPATVESVPTSDLLAAGQLPAALDQHIGLVLRSIDRRFS
jgi:hypothetical protein